MTEISEGGQQQEDRPDLAGRLKRKLREATRHIVRPDRVSSAWMDTYDRVAATLPEMDRTRGLFEKASKVAGISAVATDIAAAAVAAYGSLSWMRWARNARKSLRSSQESYPHSRATHAQSLNLPLDASADLVAKQLWRRDFASRALAHIAGLGGAAGAILAGQPIARASELTARAAGTLGERVAQAMQRIKNGDLTKHSSPVHTGTV